MAVMNFEIIGIECIGIYIKKKLPHRKTITIFHLPYSYAQFVNPNKTHQKVCQWNKMLKR